MVSNDLLIDSGNTRVKARFHGQDVNFSAPDMFIQWAERQPYERLFVGDVSGLWSKLPDNLKQKAIKVTVQDRFNGLKLKYQDVSKLGVDRWLAMVGACRSERPSGVVVVDAGTALKIDVINSSKHHLGGCIAPGIALGNRALAKNADQLQESKIEFEGFLGVNTESCINYGLVMSAVALIEQTVLKFLPEADIVVTGGDRNLLSPHIQLKHVLVDNLVLDGLNVIRQQSQLKDN